MVRPLECDIHGLENGITDGCLKGVGTIIDEVEKGMTDVSEGEGIEITNKRDREGMGLTNCCMGWREGGDR